MTEKKLEDKTINELTAEDFPKIKIQFAPGAFDDFDGSQEELDELMTQIQSMIADGSLFEKSKSVDIDALLESNDPDDQALAEKLLRNFGDEETPRNLQ
jgi:hypothetical protein